MSCHDGPCLEATGPLCLLFLCQLSEGREYAPGQWGSVRLTITCLCTCLLPTVYIFKRKTLPHYFTFESVTWLHYTSDALSHKKEINRRYFVYYRVCISCVWKIGVFKNYIRIFFDVEPVALWECIYYRGSKIYYFCIPFCYSQDSLII